METQGTPNPSAPNLAQAPATPPVGYAVEAVAVPPRGETVTVPVVPGVQYQLDVPEVTFAQQGNNLVAEAPDGGQVVFEDYFTFASSELPPAVALAEGGVVPQEQIFADIGNPDLGAAEPAAGPAAGPGAGPTGGGAAFTPYAPGDIGTGLSTLDLLGNLDLLFDPPDPPEEPGVIDFAEGSAGIEIVTDVDGVIFGVVFEDNRPNAHVGDDTPAIPTLNILFTPADDETVTETRITGFPVGMELTLADGTVIAIDTPDQVVVLGPGLQTGIQITGMPANSDADFTLSVSMDIQDTSTGTQTATITASGTIVVDAVADLANVTAPENREVPEDNATTGGGGYTDGTPRFGVGFTAGLADTDGSEEITQVQVTVSGLIGATLAAGVSVSWGETPLWTTGGGETQVTVISVPGTVLGEGGTEVLLQVTSSLDAEGNVVLTMIPVTPDGEGGYLPLSGDAFDLVQVGSLDLSALQVTLPQHADDSFTVRVGVTTEETNTTDAELPGVDNNVAVREVSFDVVVRAVADAPDIFVENKTYDEDQAVPGLVSVSDGVASYYAGFAAAVTDTDGSESLTQVRVTFADNDGTRNPAETVTIGGVAVGETATAVTVAAQYIDGDGNTVTGTVAATATFVDGVLTLTPADGARVQQVFLDNANGTPLVLGVPEHTDDDYTVTVEVTSTETNPIDGVPLQSSTTSSASFNLEIRAVADTPTIVWNGDASGALTITYVDTNASFQNILGVYIVGPDGQPTDAQLIFADTGSTEPGTVLATLPPGAEYRFFLIEKGATQFGGDLDTLNGQLSLTQDASGKMVLQIGATTVTHVYYSDTAYNFDSTDHVRVGYNADGSLTIGFEDRSNGGDGDYNDVIVTVGGGSQNFEDYNNASPNGVGFGVGFVAATPDQDGSEHLSNITVTFSGLADANATTVLFGGTAIGETIEVGGVTVSVVQTVDPVSGTITLTLTPTTNVATIDLGGLRLQLPEHSDDDFRVDVSVTTTESTPEGAVAVPTNTVTSGFDVIVDAVADRPVMDTSAAAVTVGETRAVALDASATFTDVADGSESHYLLVQVPGAPGEFAISSVTGADGGVYHVVTVTGGVVSGTGLPTGFDYSALADGTYVLAQVDGQLNADGDRATLTVNLTAPALDAPGTVSEAYSAKTYAIAIETNPTDGELDLDNNVAIVEGSTWTVTVTDDTPTATNRSVSVNEDGLTKTATTEIGTTAALFAFHTDVTDAHAAFANLGGITVSGLAAGTTVTWAFDGADVVGTVAGDDSPSIRLGLTGSGNDIRVRAELLKPFDTADAQVRIGNVSVVGTDQDGDTATAIVTVNVADDAPAISATMADAGSANVGKALEGDAVGGAIKLDIGADGGTLSASIDGGAPVELVLQPDGTYAWSDPATGETLVVTLGAANPATAERTGTWSLTTPNLASTATHTIVFTATDGDGDVASSTTLHYIVADHLPKVTGDDKTISIGLAEGNAAVRSDSVVIDFGTDAAGSSVVFHTAAAGAIAGDAANVPGITVAGVSETLTWSASAGGTVLTGSVGGVPAIRLTLTTEPGAAADETVARVTAQILNATVFDNVSGGNPTAALTIGGLSLLGSDGGHPADTDTVLVPVSISVADGVPQIAASVNETAFPGNVAFVGEGQSVSGALDLSEGPDGLATDGGLGMLKDLRVTVTGEGGGSETRVIDLLMGVGMVETAAGWITVNLNGAEPSWTFTAKPFTGTGGDIDRAYDLTFTATDADGDTSSSAVHVLAIDTSSGGNLGGISGGLMVTVDTPVNPLYGNLGAVTETEVAGGHVAKMLGAINFSTLGIRISGADGEAAFGDRTAGSDAGGSFYTYTATLGGETFTLKLYTGGPSAGDWSVTTPNVSGTSATFHLTFREGSGMLPQSGTAHLVVVDSAPVVEGDGLAIAFGESAAPGASGSAAIAVDFGHDLAGSSVTFANAGGGGVTGISVANLPGVVWTAEDGGRTLIGTIDGTEAIRLAIVTEPGAEADTTVARVTATLASGHVLNAGSGIAISGVVLVATDADGDAVSVPVSVSVADGVPTISAEGSDFSIVTEQVDAVTGTLAVSGGADGIAALDAVIRDASGAVVEIVSLSSDGSGGYLGTGDLGTVVTVTAGGAWSLVPGNVDGGYAEYAVSFAVTDGDGDTAVSDGFGYVVVDGRPEIVAVGGNASGAALDPVAPGVQQVSGTISLVSVDPVATITAKVNGTEIVLAKTGTGEYAGAYGSQQMRMSLTQTGANWTGTWVLETAMVAALTSYTVAFQAVEAAAGSDPLGGDGDASNWTVAVVDAAPKVTVGDPATVSLTDDGHLVIGGSFAQSGTGSLSTDGATVSGSTWSYTLDANAGEDKTDLTFVKTDGDGDVAKAAARFVAVTMAEGETGDLTGTDGDDILVGSDEGNTLIGGDGDDHLFGRDGDDVLVGGDGNDVLVGGAGNDVLIGGAGADTFKFGSVADGHDTIADFQLGAGGDTIDLDALFDALGATPSEDARDALVSVTHQSGDTYVVGVAGHADFSVTVQVENPGGASHEDVAAQIKAQVDTHG